MKHAAVFTISLIAIAISGCDKLIEPKDKGLVEIRKVEQRWSDGLQLAGSTARIALSPQVANLQSIKRDLDGVVVSECLKEAKVALSEHMELSIRGFLEFMSDRKYSAEKTLEESSKKIDDYKQARDKCVK